MKKTFLAKRNSLLSSSDVSWGTIAIIFAIVVLVFRITAPNFFWYIITPAFRSAGVLSEKSNFLVNSFGDTAKLASQNEKLMEENAALASENQSLSQKIESIFALSSPQTMERNIPSGILAGVVARPPESPYDILVIAAGKNEGITVGMRAFGIGSVPIGIISSAFDDFSQITLFSAPSVKTEGWVGNDNLPVNISGAGAGAMNAVVARSAGIEVGDIVFASGPGMLPIGTVVRIGGDLSSPSVTLRIQPVFNPFSIAWVVIRDIGL